MLKSGFTTGTAAAAAAKAALTRLVTGTDPEFADVLLLTGSRLRIPVHRCRLDAVNKASATVIKDAGDDPDVTHGAEIGATVTWPCEPGRTEHPEMEKECESMDIPIAGGEGVGRVTLPGLEVPPGEAAINPGPRKMIRQAVREVLEDRTASGTVCVEIFVPEGKRLAEKTLNARLGILGGISILGTTGIVRPMSHAAYEATIASALSVARAGGCGRVVMTTGRRSERFARSAIPDLPETAFIQIGDFFKISLELAVQKGIPGVTLAVLFGKAVKMAQGVAHTHAAKSDLSLSVLSQWALESTGDRRFSRDLSFAHTAREALSMILSSPYPDLVEDVGRRMLASARRFAGPSGSLEGMIFDYSGKVLYRQ